MLRAVFGGSFDPVHCGHLAMARAVLEAGLADVVHIIPAWRSPFKETVSSSVENRLAMVRLAFGEVDGTLVETIECDRGEVSYTVDSLEELNRRYPDDGLLLMVGADNLEELPLWHNAARIAELASLIILGRDQKSIQANSLQKIGFPHSRLYPVPDFDYPVSSTVVREQLLKEQYSAVGLPPAVLSYIRSHGLYGKS